LGSEESATGRNFLKEVPPDPLQELSKSIFNNAFRKF
jgi:hypothetical protein